MAAAAIECGRPVWLDESATEEALHAAGPGWLLAGYSAIRRMILHLPLFAMVLVAAVAFSPCPMARRLVVGGTLLFLLPVRTRSAI